jgi:hypothetical protein
MFVEVIVVGPSGAHTIGGFIHHDSVKSALLGVNAIAERAKVFGPTSTNERRR